MAVSEQLSDFIDFPSKEAIVERLLDVDESARLLPLYETIGERLAAKTYERSASAFILIEMLYEFEDAIGSDMSYLLPRSIFNLTGDKDLALSALGAFNEIKDAIKLQPPPARQPTQPPPLAAHPTRPPATTRSSGTTEMDLMMNKLQTAQKALADLGLATRVSIDMTARRPSRDRVSRTLQDIASLRGALRRFEELLSEAEIRVLEAAGVLWEGSEGRGPVGRMDGGGTGEAGDRGGKRGAD